MGGRRVELELRDVAYSDPQVTVEKLPRLVSAKVGIIQRLQVGQRRAQDPVTLALGASSGDLSRVAGIANSPKAGGGGIDMETAIASTIGEAVERYCMYWCERGDLIFGSYEELLADAAEPELLRLYSECQIRDAPKRANLTYFDNDTKLNWVWSYSLTRARRVLVPASFVYLNYEVADGEAVVGWNTSTGLAAGATLEEAVLRGLQEVVERDAFAISWLRRRVGPAIRVDDQAIVAELGRFQTDHPAVDLRIHDISLDVGIQCLFGVLRRPLEFGPVLCVSSVARNCPREAVRKCLREIGQGVPYARYLRDQLADWEPAADYGDVRTFDHHYALYCKKPDLIARHLRFFDDATAEVRLSKLEDVSTGRPLGDVRRIVRLLEGIGHEVLVVDITTPDVEEVGLRVVRVIVPGLVPLHGNHSFPYLGVRRLFTVPDKLGWRDRGWDGAGGINPDPHPFP